MKEVNKIFLSSLLTSIIFFVLGLLLLFFPDKTLAIISYALGGIIAAVGIMGIIKFFTRTDTSKYSKYGLAYGIVLLIIAALFFFRQDDILKALPFVLGMFIIINSATKIEFVVRLKKDVNDNWKVTLLLLIVSLILGIILIFNPLKTVLVVTQVIGIFLIFISILEIIASYLIKCNLTEENAVVPVEPTVTEQPTVIETPVEEPKKTKPVKK